MPRHELCAFDKGGTGTPLGVKRILFVDDEEEIRFLMDNVLRSAGYEVDTVETASDARSHVASRSYDLVIADNRLGDGSGITIANEAAGRGMKTVIISGYAISLSATDAASHEILMKPFRPAELLEAVERYIGSAKAPHLERAMLLHQKVTRNRLESYATAALLRQVSFGVIVADAAGRVVTMNRTAERIIAARDGLTLEDGVLTPVRSFERAKLSKALAEPTQAGGTFLVGRPSGRLPYAFLIMPLLTELRQMVDARRPIAMILVTDFDIRVEIRAVMLRELFGFTGAEAELAVAMAQGRDLRQIASETGRALPTLRSHLSAMFEKTGVKRQTDIVRLVLSIPAMQL
jgi:DNA-binding response OmpR family regulator/DNA-binding CsgD family transcriptional regulator